MTKQQFSDKALNLQGLINLYKLVTGKELSHRDGLNLQSKIKRIEKKMQRLTEENCNGKIADGDFLRYADKATKEVQKCFDKKLKDFFINGDPRGSSLKINTESAGAFEYYDCGLLRDYGGYLLLSY